MQLSHTRPVTAAMFDDPNLVSSARLVPVMARSAGLRTLVAGMLTGADSIDDMAVLRHGGMGTVFDCAYAPSTLGSFLRQFTFGHVRQRARSLHAC